MSEVSVKVLGAATAPQDFIRNLTDILTLADLTGEFKLTGSGPVDGLKEGGPILVGIWARGTLNIQITYQHEDAGFRTRWMLTKPIYLTSIALFHQRLQEGFRKWNEKKSRREEAGGMTPLPTPVVNNNPTEKPRAPLFKGKEDYRKAAELLAESVGGNQQISSATVTRFFAEMTSRPRKACIAHVRGLLRYGFLTRVNGSPDYLLNLSPSMPDRDLERTVVRPSLAQSMSRIEKAIRDAEDIRARIVEVKLLILKKDETIRNATDARARLIEEAERLEGELALVPAELDTARGHLDALKRLAQRIKV